MASAIFSTEYLTTAPFGPHLGFGRGGVQNGVVPVAKQGRQCAGIFRKLPETSGIFRNIPEYSGIFQNIPEYSGKFRKVPESLEKFGKLPETNASNGARA